MMTLKQITHWSWLFRQKAVNQIHCPPDLHVTIEQFTAELAKQVKTNYLSATVELCEVNWSDTDTKQTRILVRHISNESLTDMAWFLVGMDYEGLFTFIEEEVYWKPPQLPEIPTLPKIPRKKKSGGTRPSKIADYILSGLIGVIVAAIYFGSGFVFFPMVFGVFDKLKVDQ